MIPVHRKEPTIMFHNKFPRALQKAFQFYAGLALMVFLSQLLGIIMYIANVWPGVRDNISVEVSRYVGLAVVLILIRSCIWIRIYWSGAQLFSIVHLEGDSPKLADRLTPILKALTRLLVVSCILDICFLPVIFLSDTLLPFSISGLWLGAVYLSILLLPEPFGLGALLLAFLAHQYGRLLRERGQMKEEIELTI